MALEAGEAAGAFDVASRGTSTLAASAPPFLQATALIPSQNRQTFRSAAALARFVLEREGSYVYRPGLD